MQEAATTSRQPRMAGNFGSVIWVHVSDVGVTRRMVCVSFRFLCAVRGDFYGQGFFSRFTTSVSGLLQQLFVLENDRTTDYTLVPCMHTHFQSIPTYTIICSKCHRTDMQHHRTHAFLCPGMQHRRAAPTLCGRNHGG